MKLHRLFGKPLIVTITVFMALTFSLRSESIGLPIPVIDRFEAVRDCITPDSRVGILSYRVTNVSRVRIEAIHSDSRSRTFYSQGGRTDVPAIGATGVADPGAASDVEAYVLVATGADGSEVRRRLAFRYNPVVEFELLLAVARHSRSTRGRSHLARYQSDANPVRFDSLGCRFEFEFPIDFERARLGIARLTHPRRSRNPVVTCDIEWRDIRKARARGAVFWTAISRNSCTSTAVVRRARVRFIP